MDALIGLLLWLQEQPEPKPPFEASVVVQECHLRQTARPLSKILATLKAGQPVTVLQLQDGRARVRTTKEPAVEGWTAESSVMEQQAYVAREQAAGTDPSRGAEGHAAAKGFDPETERDFRQKKNLEGEYAVLDRLEAMPAYRRQADALEERLRSFRQKGGLGEFRR